MSKIKPENGIKIVFGIIIVLVIGISLYAIFHSPMSRRLSVNIKATTHLVPPDQQPVNPLSLYAAGSLSCSTSASVMPLTPDYSITEMGCSAPGSSSTYLICNGTITQHAVDVSLGCYRPHYQAAADQLECSGTTDALSSPTNLSLNYTCALPSTASNKVVYSCNGNLANYSSFAINLPLSVACAS
ncbi:hypothetical protein M1512_01380 [Patescibacteria group bacterium]|jgi:hypothetical protein|nr:hypothetical protein [Patescibacteria group bacterium]